MDKRTGTQTDRHTVIQTHSSAHRGGAHLQKHMQCSSSKNELFAWLRRSEMGAGDNDFLEEEKNTTT